MYTVYADNLCIHSDKTESKDCKLINPKLVMENNASGSLSFKIPSINIGYDFVNRLKSFIHVFKDDEWLWSGRVVDETKDMWNNRSITCEGVLGFLNDTFESQMENSNGLTVRERLEMALANHNNLCRLHNEPHRVIEVGAVTVTGDDNSTLFVTNFENTMDYISTNFAKKYGGHFVIRNNGDVLSDTFSWYLDYLRDPDLPNLSNQTIQFGINLIDFTQTWDINDLATAVIPIGDTMEGEDNPFETIDKRWTIASVNGGVEYLYSEEAVRNFGFIQKILDYSNISDPAMLKSLGEKYLRESQFEKLTLEITAMDLHYLNKDIDSLNLHDKVRCISHPHGMDKVFPVTKIEIALDNPENTSYLLGSSEIQKGMSGKNTSANSELMTKIKETPSKKSVLTEAKDAATQIMELATNGYITIVTNDDGTQELYISDSMDYTEATRLWRWNINGLAYSNDGGRTYGLAMTMDGSIVADYITTGTLNADIVRTGLLKGITGNSYWDLDTGKLYVDGELFSTGEYADIRVKGGTIEFLDKQTGNQIARINVNDKGQIYLDAPGDGVLIGGDDFNVFSDSDADIEAVEDMDLYAGGDITIMSDHYSGSGGHDSGGELHLYGNGDVELKADDLRIYDAGSYGYYTAKEDGSVVKDIWYNEMEYISRIEATDNGGIRWWTSTREVIGGYNTVGVFKGFIIE